MHKARVERDDGMITAEYAVGTVAACAFAALLYKLVTGGGVTGLVLKVLTKALDFAF